LPDAAILVLTHLPDRERAEALARSLVTDRLAACVSVGACVLSMYHWRDQFETAEEVPLVIKTRRALYGRVEAAILAAHPYELPEVVAVPLTDGSSPYLAWIAAETAQR
jgi:periplasmic divalent cation tolerance protein